ncbi:SICAvar, type I (fragment), partial [Plasmodium knowlesi strain H]
DKFWTKDGEVDKLWKELAKEMTEKGKEGKESHCGTMDDGSATSGTGATGTSGRPATKPERKACNYLHAGLTKLYDSSTTVTLASPSSSGNDEKILDKNPLLRQTVGCFLLKEYGKQLQKTSTCVIDSGIEKAFRKWNEDNKSKCNGSGAEPCFPCEWKEKDYDDCKVTTNGTTQTPVTDKLSPVQGNITRISNFNLKYINDMSTLCDYIRCAGPKWFKNEATANGGNSNQTWCEFWNDGVKPTLQAMFNHIEDEGKTNTNYVTCRGFGDGNPLSVERKACNYIAEGLKYIKEIPNGTTAKQPNGNDNVLLARAVGCIALNMYANRIMTFTQNSCPIDEERIKKMFDDWNAINNNSCSNSGLGNNNNNNVCFKCDRIQNSDFGGCHLSVADALVASQQKSGSCPSNGEHKKVHDQMKKLLEKDTTIKMKPTLDEINKMDNFCTKMQCAAKQYHTKSLGKSGAEPVTWDEIKGVVDKELKDLLNKITNEEKWEEVDSYCNDNIKSNGDTPGEITAKKKACKLFALGLKHISDIKDKNKDNMDVVPLKQTMMCAALNLYADQLIEKSTDQCPLDNTKLKEAIEHAFKNSNATMKNGANSCPASTKGPNFCFVCNRQDKSTFPDCKIGKDEIKDKMTKLITENDNNTKSKPKSKTNNTPNMDETLDKINKIETFCTQVQCAIKQKLRSQNKLKNGTEPSWDALKTEIETELKELLAHMSRKESQAEVIQYCNDDANWSKLGHKEKHTNKAACLLFASGLKHIYTHINDQKKDPSFEQTMGCLFLKEYAKQLKKMAEEQKKYKVHPNCSVDSGIDYAFNQSNAIMEKAKPPCEKNVPNSCFECTQKDDYGTCFIGAEKVRGKVEPLFKDNDQNKKHMEETLENTVCPILITDLLTPFLPLAPVSIGLSAMAYYLWKYFGPLGKGGARFRRSPAEIPGPSVQEQVLDHVQPDSSHEYRLVKERKPPSAPTRTKRSGRVNRRTIIEIHFEVLDECQKGDTQLNQKDFLELLVQEFMGSEFMEEEQVPKENVPKEDVLMEGVPLELVPIEEVPSLGSGFMV